MPFALGTLVSTALLGFALRRGLASAGGADVDGVPDWTGWQVDVAHWGGLALAAVLGLAVGVFTFHRMRRLEGEGVLLGVPLLLGGLLLSGMPSGPFDAAQDWASHYTASYRAVAAQVAANQAEEKLHPVPVPLRTLAAPPVLAALMPTVGELGEGWYDGQRPAVTQTSRTVSTLLTKATRVPDGWKFDRLLQVRMTDYQTAAAAAAWLRGFHKPGVERRVGGVLFRVGLSVVPGDRALAADARRGSRVWHLNLSAGQPTEPLTDADITQALTVVARHVA